MPENPGFEPENQNQDSVVVLNNEEKNTKYYTELLCKTKFLEDYIKQTDKAPKRGDNNSFRSKLARCFDAVTCRKKPEVKPCPNTTWHALARWIKYFEVIENSKDRWSKPHVTTLSPHYIQILRDNLEVKHDGNSNFEQPARVPSCDNEIYQSIYLNDEDSNSKACVVTLEPQELKWVISGGNNHDRFEIGRAIGGIFSCEEYKLSPSKHSVADVRKVIDNFLAHSTLVPFNSWDPRFRMLPAVVPDNVPKWFDPDMRKEAEREKQRVEGGLLEDVKRKAKTYLSDWTDALDIQIISSIIFCYFVNITPIITFGAITQDETEGYIGTIESVIGAGMCGIAWHLFAGQPLIIISQTGPMLIFDKILYELAANWDDITFLNFRFFVGIWTCLFCLLIVFFKISKYVTHITNFTEECFACLISLIFIVDGFKKIAGSLNIKQRPECDKLPNVTYFGSSDYKYYDASASCELYTYEFNTCEEIMDRAENHTLCKPDVEDDYGCNAYENCKLLW